MNDEDVLEQEGRYRVRLVQNPNREKPDGDGQGDVIYAEWHTDRPTISVMNAETGHVGLLSEITWAYARFGVDHEKVGRYLRMFHDVVSFDYLPWGRGTLLFVVTAEMAEKWGFTNDGRQQWYDGESGDRKIPVPDTDVTIVNPDDEFGSPAYDGPASEVSTRLKPGRYTTTTGLIVYVMTPVSELAPQACRTWRQWIEGDIWGYVIEDNVAYVRVDKAVSGEFDPDSPDLERWEPVDSLWGLYGHEYAEQEALSAFAAFTETETAQ